MLHRMRERNQMECMKTLCSTQSKFSCMYSGVLCRYAFSSRVCKKSNKIASRRCILCSMCLTTWYQQLHSILRASLLPVQCKAPHMTVNMRLEETSNFWADKRYITLLPIRDTSCFHLRIDRIGSTKVPCPASNVQWHCNCSWRRLI